MFATRADREECGRCGQTGAVGEGRVEPSQGRWLCSRCWLCLTSWSCSPEQLIEELLLKILINSFSFIRLISLCDR